MLTYFRFLLNLVAANLFSCAFVTPFLLWDAISYSEISDVVCSVFTVILVVSSSVSMYSQLLIGLDQFLAVTEPLHYHRKITKARCRFMCVASWLFSLSIGCLSLVSETQSGGVDFGIPGVPSHLRSCRSDARWSARSALAYFCLSFGLPFVAMMYVYTRIFYAAHSNSAKTRRNSVCSASFDHVQQQHQNPQEKQPYYGYKSNQLGVTISPPQPQDQPSKLHRISVVGHNVTVTVRHKLSTASALIAYREEGRAAKATGNGTGTTYYLCMHDIPARQIILLEILLKIKERFLTYDLCHSDVLIRYNLKQHPLRLLSTLQVYSSFTLLPYVKIMRSEV